METKKMKTLDMVYIALFACLMAICAWISIPGQIPFTLQTMGVFLAVGLLGGKRGTVAVLVYILMGAVGLPVFSGFAGGLGKLLGMTGGYIVGFLVSALLMWAMEALFGSKKWVLPCPWSWVLSPAMPSAPPGLWWSTPAPRGPSPWAPCWVCASFPTSSRMP